jgi:ubiquinol-cytochrome c reductase iron-sulfur subunit
MPAKNRSPSRRKVLRLSATVAGAAVAATLVPFIGQKLVHRKTTESGEIVDIDIAKLPAGQMMTVDWLGKPVLILRRTPEMLAQLKLPPSALLSDPASERSKQPAYARNATRSLKPEILVTFALCTHLGCTPAPRFKTGSAEGMPENWIGGFLCPCHTSSFDLAGRVHANREAKDNLAIPPHRFVNENTLRIGEDPSESV